MIFSIGLYAHVPWSNNLTFLLAWSAPSSVNNGPRRSSDCVTEMSVCVCFFIGHTLFTQFSQQQNNGSRWTLLFRNTPHIGTCLSSGVFGSQVCPRKKAGAPPCTQRLGRFHAWWLSPCVTGEYVIKRFKDDGSPQMQTKIAGNHIYSGWWT